MELPDIVNGTDRAKMEKSTINFRGLNYNPVARDGEFSAMTNLSSVNFPCLSPRGQRSTYQDDATGMTSFFVSGSVANMAWIIANNFYYNNTLIGALKAEHSAAQRQLVAFQDQIIIWPDKMVYDIGDNALRDLEASQALTALVFAASGTDAERADSVKYSSIVSSTAFLFKSGDGITLTGCTTTANNKTATIDHVSADGKTLWFTENCFAGGTEANVTFARSVPDMESICVANNRVWGCNESTIYGSKLGSAENWNVFQGISTDSYSVDVATAGEFTGCNAYGSYVVFLKEDCIHKLIGTKPTNFQLSTVICPGLGLEATSQKSIAYISGILYFKARLGIVAFTGGAPAIHSQALGNTVYQSAVACADGRRYYVSMTDGSAYSLFVYDTLHEVWHREDALQVVDFGFVEGIVFMMADGRIWKMNSAIDNEVVAWSGTLAEFTEYTAHKKIHSRLRMRVDLPAGSTLKVEYSVDGGAFQTAYNGTGAQRNSFYVPIIPKRCDSFVVRLSGVGPCKIYQIERRFSVGSDKR